MAIRKNLTQKNGIKTSLPILTKEDLLHKIGKIQAQTNKTIKQRKAFIAFLFLTACRVSEVCKYIKYAKGEPPKLIGEPIRKRDISFDDSMEYMDVLNVRTLKKRRASLKNVTINIKREPELYTIFKEYYDLTRHDDYLFPFTRQMAYKFLSKVSLFNHYMRHLRLTQLVTKYHFDSQYLKKFVNWSSSKTADDYVHLDTQDLKDKMREVKN